MTAYVFILLLATLASCNELKAFNTSEPLSVTISPKIWDLIETKAGIIENAVKSIKVPNFDGGKKMASFEGRDFKITKFKIPKTGVSFENMNNGVHLKINGVQLEVSGKVKYKLVKVIKGTINVRATTEKLSLDVELTWRDFSFTPKVKLNSNLKIKFKPLKILNLFSKKFRKIIDKELEKFAVKAVEQKLNPHLQDFKGKMEKAGFKSNIVQLSVQEKSLHVAIKPSGADSVVTPLTPTNHMACVNANFLAFIELVEMLEGKERQKMMSGGVNGNKLDIICVSPQLDCKWKSTDCSYCSDVDIKFGSGTTDKFHNCVPKISL